jgi:putative endonuclease
LSEERSDETKRMGRTDGAEYVPPMAFTYILRCADGSLYAGSTINLDLRLEQHSAGFGSQYTRRRLPVTLAWCHEFERIDEAFPWEKRIQGWSHAKREAFIEGGIDAVLGWSARTRGSSKC